MCKKMGCDEKILLGCALVCLIFAFSYAEVVEHTFHVHDTTVQRICKDQVITTVNGTFPGPTIYAREGDTLVVHVINKSPYNITIHWHGVFQLLSCWADGPDFVNQCPIIPENSYTYKFNITGQEGTLLWHAHSGMHRATVHGALVIRPKFGRPYPFPKPYNEFPIILGEWFNITVAELEDQLRITGNGPEIAIGNTINGWLGDLYPCSSNRRRFLDVSSDGNYSTLKFPSEQDIYTLEVSRGKTYLLRIINIALNTHMFYKIADHMMRVVAIDASYTNPYLTDTIVITPGQTIDVLVTADQPSAFYYMAAESYHPVDNARFSSKPATAILAYNDAAISKTPKMPVLPDNYDYQMADKFFTSLTSLVTAPFWAPVPTKIDENMFITVALGAIDCPRINKSICNGPLKLFTAGSMNNVSFRPPKMAILQAYYNKVDGIYTTDFPNEPPQKFDFTNKALKTDEALLWTEKGTKVKKLKYNATVEIILQSTAIVGTESHPMHLHGFNFFVLAQDYGNYDSSKDWKKFNLVNPQIRNTIAVPYGGWVAIRFRANNPGVWYMHCHLEAHAAIGLATVFLVENGQTPSTTLPPPPADLPQC